MCTPLEILGKKIALVFLVLSQQSITSSTPSPATRAHQQTNSEHSRQQAAWHSDTQTQKSSSSCQKFVPGLILMAPMTRPISEQCSQHRHVPPCTTVE